MLVSRNVLLRCNPRRGRRPPSPEPRPMRSSPARRRLPRTPRSCRPAAEALEARELLSATPTRLPDPPLDADGLNTFADHVAIDGDYSVVGATGQDVTLPGLGVVGGVGTAVVYHREGGAWAEQQVLTPPDPFHGNDSYNLT